MSMTLDEAERMLDEIEEAAAIAPHAGGTSLSEWEVAFCDSLREQLIRAREPTERQAAKLREIYDK